MNRDGLRVLPAKKYFENFTQVSRLRFHESQVPRKNGARSPISTHEKIGCVRYIHEENVSNFRIQKKLQGWGILNIEQGFLKDEGN